MRAGSNPKERIPDNRAGVVLAGPASEEHAHANAFSWFVHRRKNGLLEVFRRYKIRLPNPEQAISTPSSAVLLCRSITGLISTTSSETIALLSAIISIAR